MRIPGDVPKITGIYGSQKKVNRVGSTGSVASRKDVLSISSEAKDFQAVFRALREVPDIRQDKVDDIAGRIETGQYDVKGRDIADKVIRSVFDRKA
ncbi:MAG TPA: flagellar biosynthesis anti-sigma factor FlgM [Clostridia bacterium]|mgnify:CR=1 FL=1|nr:flagellar biosynthesis anti-sigma factor FlgM [Clostridiales bacterium]